MDDEKQLIERAQKGDRAAMERVLADASTLIYRLAVRMLGDPADAQDASQEILMRVASGLGSFRGDSAFRTWVYRVASNQLLTARRRRAEEATKSFDELAGFLDAGIAADLPAIEDQALVREAKLTCNARMLLCLDRDHRLAYILGEILDLSSEEGAEILEISSDAFRKRLSRARERMDEFVTARCGLVDSKHPCRCGKVAALAVDVGKLSLTQLRWAHHAVNPRAKEIDQLVDAVALFRSNPDYAAPETLARGVRELLAATEHARTP
jgi:RNA polymerase sigma factor (sigma-70 family)